MERNRQKQEETGRNRYKWEKMAKMGKNSPK